MAKRVVDRFGNVVETDDGIVPDKHSVRVTLPLMDSQQPMVAARTRGQGDAFEIDDALAQRILDARENYRQRISAGMHRHRVAPEPGDVTGDGEGDPRADAYFAMKKGLSGAWKARKAPKPVDPEWMRPDGGPAPAIGGSLATLRHAYGDRRAQAYADYVHRISTAWQRRDGHEARSPQRARCCSNY
jgi:hypothetical protein